MQIVFRYFIFCLLYVLVKSLAEPDEISEFKELLAESAPLAVLFTQECCACIECVETEVLLGAMSPKLESELNLRVVRLRKSDLRKNYGIKSVPSLVYIRENIPAVYDGKFEINAVLAWLEENQEPLIRYLDDDTFEHLTQAATGSTTGDWLVAFYNDSCVKYSEIEAHLEGAGILLKNRVNVAIVNTSETPETVDRFVIKECPEIIFFRHGKMYRFSLPEITLRTLRRFAESFYKNSKAETVPPPLTLFDKLVIKAATIIKNHSLLLLFATSQVIFIINVIIFCFIPRAKAKNE